MNHTPSRATGIGRIHAERITVGYGTKTVIHDLSTHIPDGSFTVIVGANGSGKSTLLRTLARVEKPSSGSVLLDGRSISTTPTKEIARTVGLLPQSNVAPEGIRVAELVARGRYVHQTFLKRWSDEDEAAVERALEEAGMTPFADRPVDTLSGGQRQRAWVAMALAREAPILLLDEPTTYLDLAHQVGLLELLTRQQRAGTTVVAVLHDLNQAARYGTHLIAMKDGEVATTGAPAEVLTAALVRDVFDLDAMIVNDPVAGTPMVVPLGNDVTTRA